MQLIYHIGHKLPRTNISSNGYVQPCTCLHILVTTDITNHTSGYLICCMKYLCFIGQRMHFSTLPGTAAAQSLMAKNTTHRHRWMPISQNAMALTMPAMNIRVATSGHQCTRWRMPYFFETSCWVNRPAVVSDGILVRTSPCIIRSGRISTSYSIGMVPTAMLHRWHR